jgi:uncharacterized protein
VGHLFAILLMGVGSVIVGPVPGGAVPERLQTTTWRGTIDAGGAKLRLEIDITEESGNRRGELRSLDQNNATFPLAEISTEGDSLNFSIPALSAHFRGKRRSDRTVVDGTFTQSGVELPLVLTSSISAVAPSAPDTSGRLTEAWVGSLRMGMMTAIMQFRIVVRQADTVGYFDSVTEGQTGFLATRSIHGDSLAFDVPRIRLTYRGTLNDAGDTAEGIWTQGGREVPLTLKRQDHAYDNTANVWANRPQRPVGPFPYDSDEVTFENRHDSVTLAGTLTIPKTAGRHPAVVLISGSGPQDRDETLMEHKPFMVLADYLSRRGIAVLRYDDRGTAKSTGRFGRATTQDFSRDASAAVEFLANHPRINAKEIGLAGHSEGGLVAPMVTGLRDDVAFVVLLAATGVDGSTVSLNQTETALRLTNTGEVEIQRALKLARASSEAALRASSEADFLDRMEPAIQEVARATPEAGRAEAIAVVRRGVRSSAQRMLSPWMRFFLAYDPRPALRRISSPVLAISGSKDVQVVPDLNEPEIRKALAGGRSRDFEIVRIDGLNHLFQMSRTGSMDEYMSIQETFNPGALKVIGDWIIARTNPIH